MPSLINENGCRLQFRKLVLILESRKDGGSRGESSKLDFVMVRRNLPESSPFDIETTFKACENREKVRECG
jgi:hypothetical protein